MINGLMYRDFQSRNIMVKEGNFFFIDFQGGRKGPLAYDAVSFIWQAKAPFNIKEREELEEFYIGLLKEKGYDETKIRNQINSILLLRTLQVLGAYGYRGLIEKKQHFIDSIPPALDNLKYLKEKGLLIEYPEIEKIANELKKDRFEKVVPKDFTLQIFSFSYKKGYPEDKTGNGGGFMFDCRAIHNPGRYEEYKSLTGRDPEVIEFLENGEESKKFIQTAVDLVIPSIETYLRRGFTSLQVGFGCTGGQHRSVYCAEKFAEKIHELYPEVTILVNHREQSIIYNK